MEPGHLRCFVVVAEELHLARVAERLHIEQSPLSRAIKELESHLAAQLFERTTRCSGSRSLNSRRNLSSLFS